MPKVGYIVKVTDEQGFENYIGRYGVVKETSHDGGIAIYMLDNDSEIAWLYEGDYEIIEDVCAKYRSQ